MKVITEGSKRHNEILNRMPDFFITGGAKCGTTTIASSIATHPDICMSVPKEPMYFEKEYVYGNKFYMNKYFSHCANREKLFGEARVFNLYIEYVSDRIKLECPKAKIIIMIRNPIDRAYSDWNFLRSMRPGREPRSFEEAINDNLDSFNPNLWRSEKDWVSNLDSIGAASYDDSYLELGMFSKHIKRFKEDFDTMVYSLDDIIENPIGILSKTFDFLEVEDLPIAIRKTNMQEYKEDINEKTKNTLISFYRDEVSELSNLLGIDYSDKWGIK